MAGPKSCRHCNSNDTNIILAGNDYFLTGEEFNIIECNSCGIVFTNEVPPDKELEKYYKSKKYISHSDRKRGISSFLYHKVRKRMLASKMKLMSKLSGTNTAEVLDIGSGTGYFPAYLESKGWGAHGIEINKDAREFALKKFSLELYGPAQMDQFKPSSFDFVTMWHTLEHFNNPEIYLDSSHKNLRKGGYLVIAVPNHHSFDADFYGKYWAAWDVPRHIWHFNPSNISSFVEKYGFKLKSMHRLPFDSFYISLLSEKYRKSVFPFIQGSLIGFVSFITSLLRKKRSSSLIYVFERRD